MRILKNQNLGNGNKILVSERSGIIQFLKDYPGMTIAPTREKEIILQGMFSFSAKPDHGANISDSYHLKIIVPDTFPTSVPIVFELDEKIPRDENHHINPDNTFCMGSPLRLKLILFNNQTLVGFAEKILVPYLYSMSHQRLFGGKIPADELAHGEEGIVTDYYELLKLGTPEQIRSALNILGTKRRVANKKPCPCNCGSQYGRCDYRKVLEQYRVLAKRSWFRNHAKNLGGFNNN